MNTVRNYNHTFTLSPVLKPTVNGEGKKLRSMLTHGYNRAGDGARCVETLLFTSATAARKFAKAQQWAEK